MKHTRADREPGKARPIHRPVLWTLVALSAATGLIACGGPEVGGRSLDAWLGEVESDSAPIRNRALAALEKQPEAFRGSPDRLERLFASSRTEVRSAGAKIALALGIEDERVAEQLLRAVCGNRVPGAAHQRAVLALMSGSGERPRRFATEILRSIDADPEAARRTLQFAIREDSFDADLRSALMRTLATKASDRRAVVRTVVAAFSRLGPEARGLEPFIARVREREVTHEEAVRAMGFLGGAESFTRLAAWLGASERGPSGRLENDAAIDGSATLAAMTACIARGDLSADEALRLRRLAEGFVAHRESKLAAAEAFAATTPMAPLSVEDARAWWLRAAAPSAAGPTRDAILGALGKAIRDGSLTTPDLLDEASTSTDLTSALTALFELLRPRQILDVIEHDRSVGIVRPEVLSCAGEVALSVLTERPEAAPHRELGKALLADPAWRDGKRWTMRIIGATPSLAVEAWPALGAPDEAARALAKADPARFQILLASRRASWIPDGDDSLGAATALLRTALGTAPELALLPLGLDGTTGASRGVVQIVLLTPENRENAPGPTPGRPMLWIARSALGLQRLLPASWPETTARAAWLDRTSRVLAFADDPQERPPTATAILLLASGDTEPTVGSSLRLWNELLQSATGNQRPR